MKTLMIALLVLSAQMVRADDTATTTDAQTTDGQIVHKKDTTCPHCKTEGLHGKAQLKQHKKHGHDKHPHDQHDETAPQ
jgi:hypothetical protein